jgi:hypothetical protein
MPTFEWQALFGRDWEALTAAQRKAFRDAVAAFVADLAEGGGFRKGLRVKKMQGREDIWEMTSAPGPERRTAYRMAPNRDSQDIHPPLNYPRSRARRRIRVHSVVEWYRALRLRFFGGRHGD